MAGPTGQDEAIGAIRQALDHFRAGRKDRGHAWLQYAQRRAPSNRHVALAIGVARLEMGDRQASEPLELLAKRDDLAEAWFQLARTRQAFGDADRAAGEIQTMLSRHVVGMTPFTGAVIDSIVRDTGVQGWSAIADAARRLLLISGPVAGALAADQDRLLLSDGDGQPVAFTDARRLGGRLQIRWAPPTIKGALRVAVDGKPLLGSPHDLSRMVRAEGFVEADRAGGLRGWCWHPAALDRVPRVVVQNLLSGRQRVIAAKDVRPDMPVDVIVRHRSFHLTGAQARRLGTGPVSVTATGGGALYGSPLDPGAEQASVLVTARALGHIFPAAGSQLSAVRARAESWSGVPADMVGPAPAHPRPAPDRGVDVIIPVYRGLDITLACVQSVIRHAIPQQRILVMVDASPERELVERLRAMHACDGCEVHVGTVNRGFTATANCGLRMSAGRDAVLLNSDTVVTAGWLDRLRAVVHGEPGVGTATPLSNDATIFSYPRVDRENPMPRGEELAALATAVQVNAGSIVDVPTGHGFCLFIRAECLAETGLLREDVFAQGYGEENDFCMRARHLGWRNVAVPSVYVAHVGSQSFGAAKGDLIARNAGILNRLHVGYDAVVQRWLRDDPLHPHRRRIDLERFRATDAPPRSALLVTHDREGGVRRHVLERAAAYEAAGTRALIATPAPGRDGGYRCAVDVPGGNYPNLSFALPSESAEVATFIADARVSLIDIHHTIGHDWSLIEVLAGTALPYTVYVHDYASFCPRITLTNLGDRYCGEPDLDGCVACVADHGGKLGEAITPQALIRRSSRLLQGAQRIVAPSRDAAKRISKRFGVAVANEPWEPVPAWHPPPARPPERPRRVALIGAIGLEKGYSLILSCARTIARQKLPLEFRVVGFTCDDKRLLDTGVVTITGRYEEEEAAALILAQEADLAFLPALWPETWSYVLTQAWAAGLQVLAFDLGAPAERIRDTGYGMVVPFGLPEPQLLRLMLDRTLFRPAAAAA